MQLLLVRHGHAGSKRRWRGDDRLRPLSAQGMEEAQALARILAPFAPQRIISSPYLRCVQTVRPLADVLGLRIERSKRLVPAAGGSAESLFRRVSRGESQSVVFCTHGEVIHGLQAILGPETSDLFGASQPRDKGSVWVLERQGGRFVGARYLNRVEVGL